MVIAFKDFPSEANADLYTFKYYRQFEGAVKDFLMDVEADAGDMSLND